MALPGITPTLQESGRDPLTSSGSEYPVFGSTSLPDPSKYQSAINQGFSNFSNTLSNMWGQVKSSLGDQPAQAQGSETRPVSYGFTETESAYQGGDAGGDDDRTNWYGNPWRNLGARNGMNQFQRTMGGLAQARQKRGGLF